jgi:hypothetical protein
LPHALALLASSLAGLALWPDYLFPGREEEENQWDDGKRGRGHEHGVVRSLFPGEVSGPDLERPYLVRVGGRDGVQGDGLDAAALALRPGRGDTHRATAVRQLRDYV